MWTKEDLLNQTINNPEVNDNSIDSTPDKVMFPLSLLIKPEIWQTLKKVFNIEFEEDQDRKVGMPHVPGNAISMATLSKDEFIKKMGMQGQRQKEIDLDLYSGNEKSNVPSGLSTGPMIRLGGK